MKELYPDFYREELFELIKEHGVDNLRFVLSQVVEDGIPYTIGISPEPGATVQRAYKITQSRWKLTENYKIEVVSEDGYLTHRVFYISDFCQIIRYGYCAIYAMKHVRGRETHELILLSRYQQLTEDEIKVVEYVEDNFFLLQPFLQRENTNAKRT